MRRPALVAAVAAGLLVLGAAGVGAVASASDPAPSAVCTDEPGVAVTCVLPYPAPETVTVTESVPVPGPTVTETLPPEPGPTVTVTATISATPSATMSPTATISATPTPTPTPSPSPVPDGFPDATTTGPTGTLGTYTGLMTITRAGTVIENVRVNGQLTIRAADVTLRNVLLTTGAYYGVLTYSPRTRIIDTRIVGGGTAGVAAYEGGTVDLLRVDVSGGEDGVRLAHNSSLVDSYVHDLAGDSSSHFDAVTADGYRGWRIEHNTILNPHSQTAAVWIGDPRYSPSEGVLANNLLAGGGYTVYAGPGTGAGLRVTNNVFSRRYFARIGYWGPVTSWSSAGNVWSGNVDEAGKTVGP